MNSGVTVYNVRIVSHAIGMRIEGYSTDCYLFSDQAKAIAFAYKKMEEWAQSNEEVAKIFHDKGTYSYPNGGYDWNDFSVKVEPLILDFGKDIITDIHLDDCD